LAAGIVYLAIAGTVVPWLLWAYVLKNVAASTASAYIFSVPLIGVAMSSLLLGEHVSAPFLTGRSWSA
jgi:drug/metabolite transporter (DMT)-like permease